MGCPTNRNITLIHQNLGQEICTFNTSKESKIENKDSIEYLNFKLNISYAGQNTDVDMRTLSTEYAPGNKTYLDIQHFITR